MLSAIVQSAGHVTVETVPDPVLPDDRGAVVKVDAAAICGSDLHFYDGDLPFFPIAPGHEAVGTVVEAGAAVRRFSVGDRVLITSVAGCGDCLGCATGDPIRCVGGAKVFGSGELGGAQSELLAVPSADFNLLRVPEGVSDDDALLLTDNLATGWIGAKRAQFAPGADVLVLGLGAIGLSAAKAALFLGAGRVFAADPVAGRRERAATFGAIPVEGATPEAILATTGGRGVDAVIDAVALDASMDDAFASVKAGGVISVIGVHSMEPYPMPLLMGLFRSVTLNLTTAPIQQTWRELVPLVQHGRLDTSGIFTHAFPLAEANDAYAAVAARTAEVVKAKLVMP